MPEDWIDLGLIGLLSCLVILLLSWLILQFYHMMGVGC